MQLTIPSGVIKWFFYAETGVGDLKIDSYTLADKGYDAEYFRWVIEETKSKALIPRKINSTKSDPDFDAKIYKNRHKVENVFARLKHFRSIATRFEKLKRNYESMVTLGCAYIWLKF